MPEKLLFIGHSLVGYQMPEMLNSFMNTLGLDVQIDKQVINGAPLRYNWDTGHWAEGVNARTALPTGDYDVVVVTEALPLDDHITWNDTHGYADRYYDLAIASNPATKFYIFETWHNIGSDSAAWRAQLEQDLPKWEGIADYINDNAPTGANPALVVPAGQAMARLYDAIEAGQVPGLSSIHDVFEDTIHLNETGNWFMATLQAATLVGVDPDDLPAQTFGFYGQPYAAPDAALAAALSEIVSQTLASYDRDGREVDVNDSADEDSGEPDDGGSDNNEDDDGSDSNEDDNNADDGSGDTGNDSGGDNGDGNSGGDGTDGNGDGSDDPVDDTPDDNTQTPNTNTGEIAFGLGFGLSSVADYVTNMPFLDVFKTSRAFLGHEPGRWGGVEYDALVALGAIDEDGWPTFIPDGIDFIGSLILTSFPAEMTQAAGRYRVTWEGEGELHIGLSAFDVTMGENEAWFSYTPDGSGTVSIEIHATDPQGNGNYLRGISVVKEEHIPAFEAGEVFNPNWVDVISDAHSLRFMDWMETNNSLIANAEDAPQATDATWGAKGVPLEIMIRLANETGTDPWFNIPHLADEAFIHAFVTQVHDTLAPGLKAYFEFSNEVWNFQFDQSFQSHVDGQLRFPGEGDAWVQNYAADAVTMARVIDQVYGANSPDVVKVIATQTGWLGLEDAILDAPAWVAENPTLNAPPSTYFDAYAITGYFDGGLGRGGKANTVKAWIAESLNRAGTAADAQGLTGIARIDYIDAHRFDYATTLAAQELRDGSVTGDPGGSLAELQTQFAYHKSVADTRGLELVMYEGGTHVVGIGDWINDAELTAFFMHLNYTAEMGVLYEELLQIWEDEGGTLFNAFTAVGNASQYGSWGHLRYVGDDNARMDVLQAFLAANPKPTAGTSPDDGSTDDETDDQGNDDGTSEDPQNTAADGRPEVEGVLREGETLTTITGTISDADGIDANSFGYQWQRDSIDIDGATDASYALTQQDVGAEIRVIVAFSDLKGFDETVQSTATQQIENLNNAPQGSLRIEGALRENSPLTVNWAGISDQDGIDLTTLVIQWMRDGVEILGANVATYLLTQEDAGAYLSVTLGYRDGFDTLELITATTIEVVQNVNDQPQGILIIDGNTQQGATLTANVTGISDADGILDDTGYFQWFRDDELIEGSTSLNYVLGQEDVGRQLSVTYHYMDSFGTAEYITSALSAPVENINDAPVGIVSLTGDLEEDSLVTAEIEDLQDADGIELGSGRFQWFRDDEEIAGNTGASYLLDQADVGKQISLTYSYVDRFGTSEQVTSVASPAVANVNDAPLGSVFLNGEVAQNSLLTAVLDGVEDADGIDARTGQFQWFRDGVEIAEATDVTYLLSEMDVGTQISVEYSYNDFFGHRETIFSNPTTSVENIDDPLTGSIFLQGEGHVGHMLRADASALRDADGINAQTANWRWLRTEEDGQESEVIEGVNTASYILSLADQGYVIVAEFNYIDDYGIAGSIHSDGLVVNTVPIGAVDLTGSAIQGEMLSIDFDTLFDADGIIENTIAYQWIVSGMEVEGATSLNYLLTRAEIGADISAKVTYVDEAGFTQSVSSEQVAVFSAARLLQGTDQTDHLVGSVGDDTLVASGGDDWLTPGAGSDVLDGGTGLDTVVLGGNQASFTLQLSQGGMIITDRLAPDEGGLGRATLENIEALDFENEIALFDGNPMRLGAFEKAALLSNEEITDITELYVAYFNRAPDAIGLTYWASRFADGFDLKQMANSFFQQPEARAAYAEMLSNDGQTLVDTESFVTAVYANVLGRAPDAKGFAYWVNQLEMQPHILPATFIRSVLGGAKNPSNPTEQTSLDQAYIATKTDIGTYFSAIKGLSDIRDASVVMSLFDGTEESLVLAVEQVNAFYAEALDAVDGDFLLQLVGVADDPFANVQW